MFPKATQLLKPAGVSVFAACTSIVGVNHFSSQNAHAETASMKLESHQISSILLEENARLRVTERVTPPGASPQMVKHKFPTVRWEVYEASEPTTMPVFYEADSEVEYEGVNPTKDPRHDIIFELLDGQPRYSESEIQELREKAKPWTTDVGNELLFENDYVRLWDFRESKGMYADDLHLHVLDYAFVVLGEGNLKFYKPDLENNNELVYIKELKFPDRHVEWISLPHGGFEADKKTPSVPAALHSVGPVDWDSPEFREFLIELK